VAEERCLNHDIYSSTSQLKISASYFLELNTIIKQKIGYCSQKHRNWEINLFCLDEDYCNNKAISEVTGVSASTALHESS
jgi:hypothetical protein